jgi:hypothetical protein
MVGALAVEGWPEGVEPIKVEDLDRLGIGPGDQLFWDGRRIEIRRPLDLTTLQKIFAVVVAVFAVLGGIGGFFSGFSDASQFLCARNINWLSCPLPQMPPR